MGKRRPSGDGMVRKRDDGRWEGRIVVGHKENGDSIFRYVYAPTQKELTSKLRQLADAYEGADLTEESRMTLGEWLDRWLETIEGTIRPSTLRNYRTYVNTYIKPRLGGKQVSKLTPEDARKLYRDLKAHGRMREHPQYGHRLSDSMIHSIHTTLYGAMKAAEQARLIARNPVAEVAPPKVSYKPMRVLNDRQLDVFMETIKADAVWYDFFYTELTTGLRQGEICALRWEDFDEKAGVLKVRRTLHKEKGGRLVVGETKTGSGTRQIVLPQTTATLLKERKATSFSASVKEK